MNPEQPEPPVSPSGGGNAAARLPSPASADVVPPDPLDVLEDLFQLVPRASRSTRSIYSHTPTAPLRFTASIVRELDQLNPDRRRRSLSRWLVQTTNEPEGIGWRTMLAYALVTIALGATPHLFDKPLLNPMIEAAKRNRGLRIRAAGAALALCWLPSHRRHVINEVLDMLGTLDGRENKEPVSFNNNLTEKASSAGQAMSRFTDGKSASLDLVLQDLQGFDMPAIARLAKDVAYNVLIPSGGEETVSRQAGAGVVTFRHEAPPGKGDQEFMRRLIDAVEAHPEEERGGISPSVDNAEHLRAMSYSNEYHQVWRNAAMLLATRTELIESLDTAQRADKEAVGLKFDVRRLISRCRVEAAGQNTDPNSGSPREIQDSLLRLKQQLHDFRRQLVKVFDRLRVNAKQSSAEPGEGTRSSVAPTATVSPAENNFRYGEDFRSVTWRGVTCSFTPNQAAVVEVLHQAALNRTPDVADATLLEKVESKAAKLRDVFKSGDGDRAWGHFIVSGARKGTHRLNPDIFTTHIDSP